MRSNDKRIVHGTLEGYKALGCRCKPCQEIWELYTQEFKEIFDETKAKHRKVKYVPEADDYSEQRRRY